MLLRNEKRGGEWKMYFDGSCSKEAGAAGIVLENSQGKQEKYNKNLGNNLTYNQSEYATLITSLEIAKGKTIFHLSIKGN
jgi:ribonuclease HI